MIINLNNLLVSLGIIATSYLLGFITVWNGPFSGMREWAVKWPINNIQWGLHFPLLGLILVTPFVPALFFLFIGQNRKVGFGFLILGCLLSNGWIAMSLHIHD